MTRLKASSAALVGVVVLACGLATACGGEVTSRDPSDGEQPVAFAAGGQSATCLRPEAGDSFFNTSNWYPSPYWAVHSQDGCSSMEQGVSRVLQAILAEMYASAPAAQVDKAMHIGDQSANSSSKDCEGHPAGSHGYGSGAVDLGYFVRGERTPAEGAHPAGVFVSVLDPKTGKVDPTIFDLERNVTFWKKLCAAGLLLTAMVDPAIRDYVEEQGFDFNPCAGLDGGVREDGFNWQHDHHQHVVLSLSVDWSYFTCPAVCGDGLKEQSEACDAGSDPLRGNGAPYSTCDASCKLQPKMSAKSCVNAYCQGTNNVIFPVRNRPSNPGDTQQNPYPAYCTGTWWIDTRGSTFDSDCTTGWVRLDHCQRPNGAQFAKCPAVSFCGDGTTDAGEQCDSGAQNGQISLAQLCDEACHRVELRTCINSGCSGTNSILTEVANTSTGQNNGGRKFYCKGSWTVSAAWTLYDSTCSTVWKEVF